MPEGCPGELHVSGADMKLLREKKGYAEGSCGTGKQQMPEGCPGELHVSGADMKLLREKKGYPEGSCGTGMEEKNETDYYEKL